jgi:hypothetical protein
MDLLNPKYVILSNHENVIFDRKDALISGQGFCKQDELKLMYLLIE